MKNLVLVTCVLGLFVGSVSFASSKVGVEAEYSILVEQDAEINQGTIKHEVLEYDNLEDKYKVRTKVEFADAQTQDIEDWIEAKALSQGAQILADCETKKYGVLLKVTVAAGTFDSCYIIEEDKTQDYVGQFWVGDTPFTTYKSIETQFGEKIELELTAIK